MIAPTLFILGAGASQEVGLPDGIQLAEQISSKLNIHTDEWGSQICVSLGYAGDFNIAAGRALEGKTNQKVQALIPPKGATLFFDTMAIPKDAKNVKNAHAFINFIMKPEVHAQLTNQVFYGNPNSASKPFVKPELANNPVIFPPATEIKKMAMPKALDNAARRLQTRTFTNFKANLKK